MEAPRVAHHFSREALYTDLETRIQYLHSFIDFSHDDVQALASGAKYIKALIPAVVQIVYRKLLQYDVTARAFQTRSTTTESVPDGPVPDEDSPQMLHRKLFLRAYLAKLCSDPSRFQFWEYLDKVGMMHVGLGRAHPLHVEYIHLGITLAFIQDIMTDAILSHPRLDLPRKTAIVRALGKVIWIQNDLMAKWQVRDAKEFEVARGEIVVEREGYLHGEKVLDEKAGAVLVDEEEGNQEGGEEEEEHGMESPSRIPRPSSSGSGSTCPFAAMATISEVLPHEGVAAPVEGK